MALRLDGFVDLPARVAPGDFGHAAIHEPARRLDVTHTANAGAFLPRTHRAAAFADA